MRKRPLGRRFSMRHRPGAETVSRRFSRQRKRAACYKALAAGTKEPLRSQLIALLREHKTGEATRRNKEASGQDYETSYLS